MFLLPRYTGFDLSGKKRQSDDWEQLGDHGYQLSVLSGEDGLLSGQASWG
jgi:hypothetical protein